MILAPVLRLQFTIPFRSLLDGISGQQNTYEHRSSRQDVKVYMGLSLSVYV